MKVILRIEEDENDIEQDLGDMPPTEAKALVELYKMANEVYVKNDVGMECTGAFIDIPTNVLTIALERKINES